MKRKLPILAAAFAALIASLAAFGYTQSAADWGTPVSGESVPFTSPDLNTAALEGCPIVSPDGLSLYIASDRPGGQGGIDIWVADRAASHLGWGAPRNLGPGVNSSANDFCPTPVEGGRLFFVSNRPGTCGGTDIYVTTQAGPAWTPPQNIGCQTNSAADEFSPAYVHLGTRTLLFFSSGRAGGFAPEAAGATPDHDIYVAELMPGGGWSSASLVPGVNSAAEDSRPNVRWNGLELVFDSTRPGGLGGPDIYYSSRGSVNEPWSAPVNLTSVNSAAPDTRASLSYDGTTLYFGSGRPGGEGNSDIYFSKRGGPVFQPTSGSAPAPGLGAPSTGDGGLVGAEGNPALPAALVALTAVLTVLVLADPGQSLSRRSE
jgi:Tol biopolymer transport system component